MTFLALDIGRVRTGIAVSDPDGRVATPKQVLATERLLQGSAEFDRLLSDYDDVCLLVGLPVSLDGQEHGQAAWVRQVATTLAERHGLPLVFQDERLSTAQAASTLRQMGCDSRGMRGRLDMVAASVFLQSYLDGLHREDRTDC